MTDLESPPSLSLPEKKKRNTSGHVFVLALMLLTPVGVWYALREQIDVPVVTLVAPPAALQTGDVSVQKPLPPSENPSLPSPTTIPDLGPLNEKLGEFETKLERLESQQIQNQQQFHKLIIAFIAIENLNDAARMGLPFAEELRTLQATFPDLAALNKLEPYAEEATPTLSQLREKLMHQDILKTESRDTSLWTRLKAALQNLIAIHSLQNENLTAIEDALQQDNAPQAMHEFDKLPPETQATLETWHKTFKARADINEGLKELASDFAARAAQGEAHD